MVKKIIDLIGWPALIVVIVVVIGGLLGGLFGGLVILRQARELADLRRTMEAERKEAATKTKTITQDDMEKLLRERDAVIERQFATFGEVLKVIASSNRPGGPIVIERTTTVPPGAPGAPGAPGKDGLGRDGKDGTSGRDGTPGSTAPGAPIPTGPMIPPADAPAAREAAIERIIASFVPGSLLNCDTVGLEPNDVEFLRSPDGRLLSTAKCVWRIRDQIKLTPPAPVTGPTVARWEGRILGGYDSTLHGIVGARLTRNLDRTWGIELEGGRHNLPSVTPGGPSGGWWWRAVGTWRAF